MMSSGGGPSRHEDHSRKEMEMVSSGGGGRRRDHEKLERKLMEKKKRIEMNNLFHQLSSLIPTEEHSNSKKELTQQECLDQATSYINKLKERIQRLKQRKEIEAKFIKNDENIDDKGIDLPVITVRLYDSNLEVVLITGLEIMIHKIIAIVMEEGAVVVSASFSTVGDKIFSTIHCHAISTRIGVDSSSIYERLKQLFSQSDL